MPKPKKPLAGKNLASNGTKAPRLQYHKKTSRAAATDGSGNQPSTSTNGGNGGFGNRGSSHNRSKKSLRSVLGFIIGSTATIAMWGWSLFEGINKSKRDRRILDSMLRKPLYITEHGLCRMDCRFVTRDHIAETLERGRINDKKSEPTQRPCPKYVVDAEVRRGTDGKEKMVQGVFAACRTETRVVTVIDKANNWPCGPC
ncbi:hypothetical protein Ndes2437B_g08484 [Nannochloris sp. 'desiccata']